MNVYASASDCVFDSVGIILFSDDSYAIYTKGLERSQLVSVLLSVCLVCWLGVLKGVSVHFSLMTLMLSTPMVLKGVNLCLSCSLLPHVSLAGVLKGVSVHVHIAMVLKELDGWSWKDLDATLWFLSCVLPSIFKQGSWKESLELVFVLFSTEIDLETFLHKTWMRPSLELAAYPDYDFFMCLGLYNIKRMVLKWLIRVMLKSQFDTAMIYQLSIIITFKVCPGSSQESIFWVAVFIQCMRKHGPERI